MSEDEIPHAEILSQEVQVGAPQYPDAILVTGTFRVDGVEWTLKKHWWRTATWHYKKKTFDKKVGLMIGRKQVEELMGEWAEKWGDFENWREVIVNKAEARKAFDDQFEKYAKCFAELFPEETYEARLAEWKAMKR